jgi:hypothetical protein
VELSLKQIASRWLGITGPLSVNGDVYGCMFVDVDASTFGTLAPGDRLPGTIRRQSDP